MFLKRVIEHQGFKLTGTAFKDDIFILKSQLSGNILPLIISDAFARVKE
ncbi:hypothetical protein [Adhaeribacter pallidiroseus]|nr:hypothetical protein [Adhaeribacter pallidiroseus]